MNANALRTRLGRLEAMAGATRTYIVATDQADFARRLGGVRAALPAVAILTGVPRP
jgi:hypothetical protein